MSNCTLSQPHFAVSCNQPYKEYMKALLKISWKIKVYQLQSMQKGQKLHIDIKKKKIKIKSLQQYIYLIYDNNK